jgi:hypothetical protein
MMNHAKALVVVLAAVLVLFWIAPLAFPSRESAAMVRRQRWAVLLVSAVAFLSPSIWVYSAALVAIMLVFLMPAGDRATRAAALWAMLLLAVPNAGAYIPGFGGIGNFFEMQHARTLTMALLLPALLTMQPDERRPGPLAMPADWFVLAYFAVQIAVMLPYASKTDLIRQGFVLTLDALLPYWVFSRAFVSPDGVRHVMRGFVLTAMLLCMLAVFESVKRWPLYDEVPEAWGIYWDLSVFIERAGFLRVKVSAGHSLAFGFVLVVALGFWAVVKEEVGRKWLVWLGTLGLVVGLAASLARGSWVGAVVMLIVQAGLGEGGIKRLLLLGVGATAFLAVASQVPALHVFVDVLPFVGNVDSENVEYRQRLIDVSLSLIKSSPWLGVPGYADYMEDLRQGQGIIDIVNSYIAVALNTGVIGLSCFIGMFVAMLAGLLRVRRSEQVPEQGRRMASQLIATTLAVMVVIVTTSNIGVIPQTTYMLLGLGVACSRLYPIRRVHPVLAGQGTVALQRRQ